MSVISNSSVGGSEACVYVMVYPGCIPPPHLSLPEHTTLTYITPPTPRSVTELCWSLTSRLCSCSVSYWCCRPQSYREDKTLSELDLPSQVMSCDEIQTLGAGSSLDTNHQKKLNIYFKVSNYSYSVLELHTFATIWRSFLRSFNHCNSQSNFQSQTSAGCVRTASSPHTLSR